MDKEIELFRKEAKLNLNNKVTKDKADLEEITFEIFSFISPKLKKFREFFLITSELIKSMSPENEIDLSKCTINDIKDFKKLITLGEKTYNLIYQFNLFEDVYENNYSETFVFSIDFKEYFYEIQINDLKVKKYYKEEVLNTDIRNMFTERIKVLMDNLKSRIK